MAFEHVPANVASLIEHVGIIESEGLEDDVNELVDRGRAGCCMTCGTELGSDIILVVNKRGVVGLYCGGACLSDMGIMGWLEEQYQDVVDRVKFRGGQVKADEAGDEAPEEEDES